MSDDLEQPGDADERTEAVRAADATRDAADAEDAAADEPEPKPDQYYTDPVTGNKFVRHEALRATRDKLKATRRQFRDADEKAKKFDMVQPYLGLLATHPDIKARTGGGNGRPDPRDGDDRARDRDRGRPVADPPPTVTDFDDVIESLGIDAAAGRKLATLVTHIADRRSARAVAPVAAEASRSSAQSARARAYAATDNAGAPYATREAIDEVFSRVPDHLLANDEVIKASLIQARGLGGPGKVTEPLHTEDTGRRGGRRDSRTEPVTDLERKLMGQHNIADDKEWQELSRQDTLLLE